MNFEGTNGGVVSTRERRVQGRLNLVQRTMLQWNDMHPYNAVHVVRVCAGLNLQRLRKVIKTTLAKRGLTGLTLKRDRATYHYAGGPATCEIKTFAEGASPHLSLFTEIKQQLNTDFAPSEQFSPF